MKNHLETNSVSLTKDNQTSSLPHEWKVVKLGEAVETRKGKKPKLLEKQFKTGYLPYLTAEYFRIGKPAQFSSLEKDKTLVTVDQNDVVFIWDGSNAGDVFTGLKGILASTMVKISPNENKLLKKTLYYFFKTQFEVFNKQTTGSTIPHVNKALYENLLVPLPPLPEQKKISTVLTVVQEAKEKTEEVIKATRELKKSLMKYLFTYGPVPVEEAEKVPLKETEIGLVPEEWEVEKLGDGVEKPQYGYTASAIEIPKGPKFLRISDIQNDRVNWSTVPYCEISKVDLEKYKLKAGDMLFARIGATTGKTYLMDKLSESVFASYLIRIRAKETLNPRYLSHFTKSDIYWRQIHSEKGGKLKQGINIPILRNVLIPLPSPSVQERISEILSAVDQNIEAEENKKKALEELFKTLLNNLMTARIRVNHLEIPV